MSQTWFHKPENALKRANGECKALSILRFGLRAVRLNAVGSFVVVVCARAAEINQPHEPRLDGR